MRRAALVALFVVTACGSTSAAAGPSPTVSPSAAQSPSPSAVASASAPASPVASLPCKMPASLRDVGGNSEVLGWLNLPSGTTTDDPVNHIVEQGTFPGTGTPIWATDHSPQLYGDGVGSWSTVTKGWVPVPPERLAPDGIHYAYLNADGKIHIVNAINQTEAIVANPNKLAPLAYTSAGVVLVKDDVASNGLWLLDPATQSIVPITPPVANYNWLEVSGGTAWGLDSPAVLGYPPAKKVITAPTRPNASIISPNNTATVAYTTPTGDSIALIAADVKGGLLIVNVGSAPGFVYLPLGGSPTAYPAPPGLVLAELGPRHHADLHGIWFIGQTGIFLFNTTTGLQKIAAGVKDDIVPGGDCV